MHYEKTTKITLKIITRKDLEKLINYFKSIKKEINNENTTLKFELKFVDGSSIITENIDILDEAEYKNIELVYFFLDNYHLRKKINVRITNDFGYLEIESNNKDWIDSKFLQLQEIIEQIPNQNKFLSSTDFIIMLGIIMLITVNISLFFLIDLISFLKRESKIIISLVGFFFSNILIFNSLIKLKQLYPTNDFDTTLIHLNKTKKGKKVLFSILVIIIIPTLLSIIVNILI